MISVYHKSQVPATAGWRVIVRGVTVSVVCNAMPSRRARMIECLRRQQPPQEYARMSDRTGGQPSTKAGGRVGGRAGKPKNKRGAKPTRLEQVLGLDTGGIDTVLALIFRTGCRQFSSPIFLRNGRVASFAEPCAAGNDLGLKTLR